MSAKETTAIDRSTSGAGTAVISAPGAGKYIHIYDGSLKLSDPDNDEVTATIYSSAVPFDSETAKILDTWPLKGSVDGTARFPQMVARENEAVFVSLDAAVAVVGTFAFAVRSIISVPH